MIRALVLMLVIYKVKKVHGSIHARLVLLLEGKEEEALIGIDIKRSS